MRTFLGRAWHWPAAAAMLAVGLLAAFAATSRAASPAATTTTTATTTAATTSTVATTSAPTTTQTPPPSSAAPPTISGTPQVGATLTATNGSWSGTQPTSYTYDWQRCDAHGSSCASISGATATTYVLKTVDAGTTLRVVVTAQSSSGSATSTSVPTAVIAATTQSATTATGCPSVPAGQAVDVTQVAAPARLQIAGFQSNPSRLTREMERFTLRVVVRDTCGHPVRGALVYATAVPFEQVTIPSEQATGADGSVTLAFGRAPRYPASPRQQLLAMFIRARPPGTGTALAGISTRRLVAVPVSLRG
jgi:hypothetical protein